MLSRAVRVGRPMPVRQPRNFGGSHMLVRFPSFKLGRMVRCESRLEGDYAELLDFDPAVTWFEEQPFTIQYIHGDRQFRYTGDFATVEAGRRFLIECKPTCAVDRDDNQRRCAAARAWCADHGYSFRLVTDADIRRGHRLANVKRLRPYARHLPDPRALGRALAALDAAPAGALTLAALATGIAAAGGQPPVALDAALRDLLHLLRHGALAFAIDTVPLTRATPIWRPGGAPLRG